MGNILTIWWRSLCAASGAIAGGTAGFLFGLAQMLSTTPLSISDAIQVGILLGLFAWVALLLLIGIWLHYGVRGIALPALITSLLSAVLTVMISTRFPHPLADLWIGLLVGTIVGAALCALCGMGHTPTRGDRGLR
ncbi:hypothetical protein [Variovorax sp. LjRoot178]|uniref:hypothetical protein n=1 Tax=Variovorax sp. LjRoot178 TaxID=3342277 RepID=UPI003F5141CB